MKRKVVIGVVISVLICVCIALNRKLLKPEDFTGAWYHAGDGALYTFEDGIITCTDHEEILLGDTIFSGAYSFAKEKAAIFVVDDNGVGDVVELYLVHHPDGDILWERIGERDIIWFCRNRDMALN